MRACASLFVLSLMSLPALAAIATEPLEYRDGEAVLEGYVAYDDALPGRRPAVLIVHEWWGLGDHVKNVARRLAELGYVAFALDMYGKGKLTTDAGQASQWAGEFRRDFALAERRFDAGLTALKKHPRVDGEKIVAIGYCFGGTVCLEMARVGKDFAGVVSFHGGLASQAPAERRALKARVLVCHGADDPAVPQADVDAFVAEMRAARADWQLVMYGNAVHSFTNPAANSERARYDEKADRRSWEALKIFLEECFKD